MRNRQRYREVSVNSYREVSVNSYRKV